MYQRKIPIELNCGLDLVNQLRVVVADNALPQGGDSLVQVVEGNLDFRVLLRYRQRNAPPAAEHVMERVLPLQHAIQMGHQGLHHTGLAARISKDGRRFHGS